MISVDAKIWSPFARPNWITNGCIDDDEKVALHKLLHLPELLGLKWLVFFFPDLSAQKQIRCASGFSGANPPMLKSVCGVYGKTIWFLFMHVNCNVFREKCIRNACVVMPGINLAEFPSLSLSLSILFYRFLSFL